MGATLLLAWGLLAWGGSAFAQQAPAAEILFRNVRVFDGQGDRLSAPTSVLVRGKLIAGIGPGVQARADATIVEGGGRTLMPGLIDAHAHVIMAGLSETALLTAEIGFVNIAAARSAETMLMRSFTSVRDLGGPVFGVKRAIDAGLVNGPRIWPAGAMVSQTSGHGDFRLPGEVPAEPGALAYADRMGVTAIADGVPLVQQRVREQLRAGASHVKLMAGGGVSSAFDPIDVTQYSPEELRAAVEAAADWGTYVTVHAYTPRAVRRAIEAGVKCIDHGHLVDEATAKLMAERGVWWSLQPFLDDEDANPKTGAARLKQLAVSNGTDMAYQLARKYRIRTAWGTDTLHSPEGLLRMNHKLTKLARWYRPADVLRMATGDNGELLALSGERSPYGRVGIVAEGAMADLLLVDGDPIANLSLIEDPERHFRIIMKDGQIFKNSL
ncbi:amidohydrolase family protein [Thermaurantiacus sp.]